VPKKSRKAKARSLALKEQQKKLKPAEEQPFFVTYKFTIFLVLTIILLVLLAWENRFIQDDAFISFRYADNLVHGKGLVWNAGERVEGYTNFLWTLVMCIPILLNVSPVTFSQGLGLLCFICTLIVTFALSCRLFRSKQYALLTTILLGTNYTFSAFATGGLETQLQALLIVTNFYLAFQIIRTNAWRLTQLLLFSLISSAALLTRLDSAIPLFFSFLLLIFSLLKQNSGFRDKRTRFAWLCLPFLAITGSWFVWKFAYYGDIVPNTFYAKVSSTSHYEQGLFYCYAFIKSYWLYPYPILFALAFIKILKQRHIELGFIALIQLLWCLYIIRIGGDFLEFRFFVPVMPLLFVLIGWLMYECITQPAVRIILTALMLLGSFNHAKNFTYVNGIESVKQLHGHIINASENWDEIGIVLRRLFPRDESGVVIAVTPAGAIPYYSRLETVDMLGLNDRWIAKNGKPVKSQPGHEKIATFEYLINRKVNLVIDHPRVLLYNQVYRHEYAITDLRLFNIPDATAASLPPASKVIEIPLNETFKLTMLYLVQNGFVDKIIERNKLRSYEIERF
jgi:arabinofuranosyltransferase